MMKKQLLAIAIVTMLLVTAISGAVNAATISASEVKDEATVVTMKMNNPQQSITLTLEYDSTVFEVDKTVGKDGVTINGETNYDVNSDEKGVVYISVYGTSAVVDTINVAFKLVEGTLDLPEGPEITGSFEVTEVADIDEEFADPQVIVVVREGNPDVDPDGNNTGDTNTNKPGNTNTDNKGNTNANSSKPGSLAPTGAPLYVAGIAVIVVAAFVLMVRKAK